MTQAIFLSYSSEDADAAHRICEALRVAGLEVWFDQSELRGGDAWDASIRKQIKECALFVPIISASTNARSEGYFRLEWKLAVDRSHLMADDQAFFLPVVIDDIPEAGARVPDRFRERQWSRVADNASLDAFARRVAQIAQGDSRIAAKPTPAPSAIPAAAVATPPTRRRGIIVSIIVIVIIACIAVAYTFERQRRDHFVANSKVQIETLSRSTKFMEAYQLAREVERVGGADMLTETLKEGYSRTVDVISTPGAAAISIRAYRIDAKDSDWIDLVS